MALPTRPTVLITGFGPFPGVERNASALVVPRLAAAARRRFDGIGIATAVLPVAWEAAPVALSRRIRRAAPRLAVHFGVSHQARGFVIETLGRNEVRDSADAAGRRPPAQCLLDGGPPTRAATLPVGAIVARLAATGFPVSTSDDAGGYLCNAVLYSSLGGMDGTAAASAWRAGFVHIPADTGEPGAPLSLPDAVAGGLEILAACLDSL